MDSLGKYLVMKHEEGGEAYLRDAAASGYVESQSDASQKS
jgi:hypothetical protein